MKKKMLATDLTCRFGNKPLLFPFLKTTSVVLLYHLSVSFSSIKTSFFVDTEADAESRVRLVSGISLSCFTIEIHPSAEAVAT